MMRTMFSVLCTGLLALSWSLPAHADDDFLERYSRTNRFRFGRPTSFHSPPDGSRLLFLRSGPRSAVRDLWVLDLADGVERRLLSAGDLLAGDAEQLSDAEKARRERTRSSARGIAGYHLSMDGSKLLVPLSGRLFVVTLADGSVRELESASGVPLDARFSPDGSKVSSVRGGDLYVFDLTRGEERRLTHSDGTIRYGESEFVAQEEMSRHRGYWWSPDSKRLIVQSTDSSRLETMHIADATRPERAPRSWPYPRPGKINATVKLGIVSLADADWTPVRWDRERYEYVATVGWPEHGVPTVMLQNREQTEQTLFSISPDNGATTPLVTEKDDAWVEIDETMPSWLDDGSGFFWTTERNGSRELEIRNTDGSLRQSVTGPSLGYRDFVRFDKDHDEVWVTASTDPTQTHLFRVPLDGGRPKRVSKEPGQHSITMAGPGPLSVRRQITDRGASLTLWNGNRELDVIPRSVSESEPPLPEIEFTTTGGDPDLHAVLVRPRNFDTARRYPVIVHVYGGPTGLMVRHDPGRYRLAQWFADHGYIVVSIDGRGTPLRGRDWHRSIKHDLITLPLFDQARGLQALGKKYPELDLDRVGIYGWSFGGYFSAMAVMQRPDVFHAGFAGAPVVDWLDYDTHYTERYLGLPQKQPQAYRVSNVLTYAEQLRRPLLILHGTDDDNVYFAHSLKLAEALFKAGRRFELLPLPGFTHMVNDPLVTRRLYERILDHFDRHLKGDRAPEAITLPGAAATR
ncbi:MAG: S9 family peptidase [Acidobacteria bacterium]|nr:MAG: S9 family peptidase [Acidobacteriota bacterium]